MYRVCGWVVGGGGVNMGGRDGVFNEDGVVGCIR